MGYRKKHHIAGEPAPNFQALVLQELCHLSSCVISNSYSQGQSFLMTKNVINDTICVIIPSFQSMTEVKIFMTEVKIEKIELKDIIQIILIENSAFKNPWKQSFFESELSLDNSTCLKAYIQTAEGKKIIGYIIVRNLITEAHILNIATHPQHKRQGVATMLLKKITDNTPKDVLIVLEVRTSNTPAQKLYKKLGFFELQRRKSYYPDGEDAIVMAKGDFNEF
jgi:[ribosomal protein S18]-alanine N-acetyltransferase